MKKATCYKYSKAYGIFEGKETAFLDPVASLREGKEVFALPPYCTFDVPLETKKDNLVCYNLEKKRWEWKPAFKNAVFWDKQTQDRVIVNGLKNNYTELTNKEPPSRFHTWDNEKNDWEYTKIKEHLKSRISEIEIFINAKRNEPFLYKNYELCYSYDFWLIEKALSESFSTSEYIAVKFFDKDKNRCDLSLEELKELAFELLNRSYKYQMNGRELIEKLKKTAGSETGEKQFNNIKNFNYKEYLK